MSIRPDSVVSHVFWLTPIDTLQPFVLGADRVRCEPSEKLELFREELRRLHPRLLLMFKAGLLPGDPSPSREAAQTAELCGMERVPFALAAEGAIRFDGPSFGLSNCAEAMTERLLAPDVALTFLQMLQVREHEEPWRKQMKLWLEMGKYVFLIREELEG